MNLDRLKTTINNDKLTKTFSILYGADAAANQKARFLAAAEAFGDYFQLPGNTETGIYSAPGRTEIGGNHTDHQRGNVLAASISMDIIAFVTKADDLIRIKSDDFDEIALDPRQLEYNPAEQNTSQALVRGVLAYFKEHGYAIGGFSAYMTSEVLKGSGLSSSAAFEVMIGAILNYEYNEGKIAPMTLALAGQFAENHYFGKMCGLMDQAASAVGGLIAIDFFDAKQPVYRQVQLDLAQYAHTLYLIDAGGSHADLSEEYTLMPSEMRSVAAALGKDVLSQVDEAVFYDKIPELRTACGDRAIVRAIHYFNENKRAKELIDLAQAGDFQSFLRRINESGLSSFCYLQNVYTTQKPQEQGLSIALALSGSVLGSRGAYRVHGGGFAGTILAFVPNDLCDVYEKEMCHVFGEKAAYRLHIRPYGAFSFADSLVAE